MRFRSVDDLPFKVFVPRNLGREVHAFATREEQVAYAHWLASQQGEASQCGCGCCGWHDKEEVTDG